MKPTRKTTRIINRAEALDDLTKMRESGLISAEVEMQIAGGIKQTQIEQEIELRQNLLAQLEVALLATETGIVSKEWVEDLIKIKLNAPRPYYAGGGCYVFDLR